MDICLEKLEPLNDYNFKTSDDDELYAYVPGIKRRLT